MRDDETGSWWQQVTGEAILGPLKGKRLNLVNHDEVSFAIWKNESPNGRVLRPDKDLLEAGKYAPADWEQRISRAPVVTNSSDDRLGPRDLVIGITINETSKAYVISRLEEQNLIIDEVGGTAILLVMAEDKKSVRAYERSIDGRKLEYYAKPGASPLRLIDAETGSEWDYSGKAVAGPLAGQQLKRVYILKDYWFDWKIYHPDTLVY